MNDTPMVCKAAGPPSGELGVAVKGWWPARDINRYHNNAARPMHQNFCPLPQPESRPRSVYLIRGAHPGAHARPMSGSRVTFDGLWRCLCPAVTPFDAARILRQQARPLLRGRAFAPSRLQSTAQAAARLPQADNIPEPRQSTDKKPAFHTYLPRKRLQNSQPKAKPGSRLKKSPRPKDDWFARFWAERRTAAELAAEAHVAQDEWMKTIRSLPTPDIYRELYRERHSSRPSYAKVARCVKYLVRVRGERPSSMLYEALIHVNALPAAGSAAVVRNLLTEMDELGVARTLGVYESVLLVLAVHPSYLLRQEMLREMRERGLTLSVTAEQHVLLGLLRDGQFELALDRLYSHLGQMDGRTSSIVDALRVVSAETLQSANSRAILAPHVLDTFATVLASGGHCPTAISIVQLRQQLHLPSLPQPAIWLHLLEQMVRHGQYESLAYVWGQATGTSPRPQSPTEPLRGRGSLQTNVPLVPPTSPATLVPDGLALGILNLAARNADPNLASDVVALLAGRGARLDAHHLEPVADAFAAAGDVEAALRALCIMHRSGVRLDAGSTRGLYACLIGDRDATNARPTSQDGADDDALVESEEEEEEEQEARVRVRHAAEALFRLRARYDVPIAVFNAVLEAAVAVRGFAGALELYRLVGRAVPSGPDLRTFAVLLARCDDPAAAAWLLDEMAAAGLRPDAEIEDLACRVHARGGAMEDAMACLARFEALAGNGACGRGRVPPREGVLFAPGNGVPSEETLLALAERAGREEARGVRGWLAEVRETYERLLVGDLGGKVEVLRRVRAEGDPKMRLTETLERLWRLDTLLGNGAKGEAVGSHRLSGTQEP